MAEVDPKQASSVYDFTVKDTKGQDVSLDKYRGKVMLIVNVASKCGFTKQYAALEELYQKYKDQGFVILGFPCNQFGGQEPGTDEEIKTFCSLKYNVSFDIFKKIDVNKANAAPLYVYLKNQQGGFLMDSIKWNFTKFLINKEGIPVKRYAPQDDPAAIAKDIEPLLGL